jgi:class 3 adenylate cyclase/tetratricopeptide (TPR) repeat protein
VAVLCPSCAAENPEGKKFCRECGAVLGLVCPTCGSAVEQDAKFCGECGGTLTGSIAPAAPAGVPADASKRVAERRLTTILFGDLVGSTQLAEVRDAEDTRELLSQYFAMANTVVARYGGTIEKFIGDAVMAVWGVPVAHEDDAERAVRAGLDLLSEVAALAEKVRVPDLNMRVGIVTGEVAVTLGAVGEGMVAGDAVNTAARIQAAAEPGQVWVDETTRSLTSAAVTYTEAGEHELKGKAEPVRLHSARTIVASVGGAQRVDGLEAPFLGRDHELRLVKELFHAALDEGRPRLVAVTGVAGVGKTRVVWEFEKYIDGIADVVLWHRGRVLSYGDGVSFWALAEMVRARLGVTDAESSTVVDDKLTVGLESIVADANEREWLRPRLAALLGLDTARADAPTSFGRDDLFAAWANFFDHVRADDNGVVLVFDDMQYADPDLLDFLDYLLDNGRFPLFVMTLARPELADARPGWGTGRRATTVYLEPLGEPVMVEIVNGLVQGLPEQARRALVERSEGIPLYALEMVRGLIDRDVVIPREGRYVLAPDADQRVDLSALDAPPSLQALIAARLDALAPAERQVVQDATAHGLVFSREALGAVSEVANLDAVLEELVRKEILEVHSDRFSAERGQYRFVQALVRTVAYETLSRRDRKARHLAVARYLEQTSEGDEVTAVIARHYLDAVDNGPDDEDAPDLIAAALERLERAARRAEALGSPDEALRHYTTALAREPDESDRARLLEGAARAAQIANRADEAIQHAEQARAAYESMGRRIDAGRVVALIGDLLYSQGHVQASGDIVRPVYEELTNVPGSEHAILRLAENLARVHMMGGDSAGGQLYNDRALELAEASQDWDRLVSLLNRQALIWLSTGRPTGAIALLRAAVDLGRREHLSRATILPLLNISAFLKNRDLDEARTAGREAVEAAQQAGARDLVRVAALNLALTCWVSGDWDEAEALRVRHHDDFLTAPVDLMMFLAVLVFVRAARDEEIDFDVVVPEYDASNSSAEYVEALIHALVVEADGDVQKAALEFTRAADAAHRVAGIEDDFAVLLPFAVESALAAGSTSEAERLVRYVADAPAGLVTPLASAHLLRSRALVGMARGDDRTAVDADLEVATQEFRDLGARFYLARTLLERARWAAERNDNDAAAPLLEEAEAIFVDLRANRWVAETRTVSSRPLVP